MVYPEDDPYSAIVVPEGLTVRTAQGQATLERSFTAELAHGQVGGSP